MDEFLRWVGLYGENANKTIDLARFKRLPCWYAGEFYRASLAKEQEEAEKSLQASAKGLLDALVKPSSEKPVSTTKVVLQEQEEVDLKKLAASDC